MADNASAFIARFAQKFAKATERKVDSSARALVERLKENTPVDTGNARDGWKLVLSGDGFERKAKITNDVPYIAQLEHGSSTQAPAGIVAVSIAEVKK